VPEDELVKALDLSNAVDRRDSLYKTKTRTNAGLTEKAARIREQWEIGQRDRDNARVYFLRRIDDRQK
jgi:hypothetical protein